MNLALWVWFHLVSVAPVQVHRLARSLRTLAQYAAGWAVLAPVLLAVGAANLPRAVRLWRMRRGR